MMDVEAQAFLKTPQEETSEDVARLRRMVLDKKEREGGGVYVWPWNMGTVAETLVGSPDAKARGWAYRKKWTTIMLGSGRGGFRLKRRWAPREELEAFIEACRVAGFKDPMPGSYAWPWNEKHLPPRVNPTTLVVLASSDPDATAADWRVSRPHAWNEARIKGDLKGDYYVYDINSAYAWAATCKNLPEPRLGVYVSNPTRRPFGIYRLRSAVWTSPAVPRRLLSHSAHWVTKEELETYGARKVVVSRGVEWERGIDLRFQVDDVLEKFPAPWGKRILRTFWGGWKTAQPTEQFTLGKGEMTRCKPLRSRHFCPPWAWYLEARVAMRCAETGGGDMAHVFTDAIMVPRKIPTGTGLGEWKLAESLKDPWVKAAGNYGEGSRIIKHAGRSA